MKQHPRLRVASIGPETSRVLRAMGIEPAVEADPHTVSGLVEAIHVCRRAMPH
jgi:uroporphyrinogen-III synthase